MLNTEYLGVLGTIIERDNKEIVFPVSEMNKHTTITFMSYAISEGSNLKKMEAIVKTDKKLSIITYAPEELNIKTYPLKEIIKISKTIIQKPHEGFILCSAEIFFANSKSLDIKRPPNDDLKGTANFEQLIVELENGI